MSDVTIVWYTCNTLDPFLMARCQAELLKAAQGKPIISVSQKPLDFGQNICVGDIGRSHISLFTQILAGAKAATTRFIALAEHDCLYTPEHFDWLPPTDDYFYYNVNHWLADWGKAQTGIYSYYRRKVLSNLICNRQLLIDAVEQKLSLLNRGAKIKKGQPGACEFGVVGEDKALIDLPDDLGKEANNYKAEAFRTILPNIDIRHDGNFSGGRRTKDKRYYLPYWGSFHAVMGVLPPGIWYQEAKIDGQWMPQKRTYDTNEKRWKKYIAPLVTGTSGTIVDLGCNAGFYCRKMADLGFKAIGVERDMNAIRHAYYWETKDPKHITIIPKDITAFKVPLSNYVLLANVHYWISPVQLAKLIAQFSEKTLNVIVIGRYKTDKEHRSPGDLEFLKKIFVGWDMGRVIKGEKHFSVIFKNPNLVEKSVQEIVPKQQFFTSRHFFPAFSKFVDYVLTETLQDSLQTEYAQYLRWRRFSKIEATLLRHEALIRAMQENGQTEPLIIGRVVDGKYAPDRLTDGDHRLIVAYKLQIPKVICRVLPKP